MRLALLIALAFALMPARAQDAAESPFTAVTLGGEAFGQKQGFEALVALPDGYADSGDSWPLVLFLHGAGERGEDLSRASIHGPARHVREGQRFPFVLVTPLAPKRYWWRAEDLGALLDDVQARYRIDLDRVYVTGLSMGGFGTWDLAETYPGRFAAVAPICGGGTPGRICGSAADGALPIWIFHGALDSVISPQRSLEMNQRLQRCDGDVRLTIYPEANHDSWTATYANPALYEWLLAQRRSQSE